MSSPTAVVQRGERAAEENEVVLPVISSTTATAAAEAAARPQPEAAAMPEPTQAGPALPVIPEPPVLYQDALFLFIAEGRRPSRTEMLVFLLGFSASMSLVFITSDLMNSKPVRPWYVTVFLVTGCYFGVLVCRQRNAISQFEEAAALASEANDPSSRVIDKETRRRLLDYFVFRPPEEEKRGETIRNMMAKIDPRFHEGEDRKKSDALESSSSGRGTRFSMGYRGGGTTPGNGTSGGGIFGGMLSFLPTRAASPPPSPPPEVTLPTLLGAPSPMGTAGGTTGTGGAGSTTDRSTGDCEQGTLAALPAEELPSGVWGGRAGGIAASPVAATRESESGRRGEGRPSGETIMGGEAFKADVTGVGGEWSTAGSCIVCFGDYAYGEELCRLPCRHLYHAQCIDEWLDGANHGWCPLCKADITTAAAPTFSAFPANNRSNNGNIASQRARGRRTQRNSAG